MSKDLVLTGLGNEVDLKTQRTVFTAIFNKSIRIEISKEAAEILTKEIYANSGSSSDYEKPPIVADDVNSDDGPVLTDMPGIYEEETGVEQV